MKTTHSIISRNIMKYMCWYKQPVHIRRDRVSTIHNVYDRPYAVKADTCHTAFSIVLWFEAETRTMYLYSNAELIMLPGYSHGLFIGCVSMEDIEDDLLDYELVYDANYMFFGCESLRALNIRNMINVKETDYMFTNCKGMREVVFTDCDFSQVDTAVGMFRECISLRRVAVEQPQLALLLHHDDLFLNCNSLKDAFSITGNHNSWSVQKGESGNEGK